MREKFFAKQLLEWNNQENIRELPWKGERDPYKIWLSEIILQQTRAQQGLPYYEAFLAAYPDVSALANAPEQEVFRLWQGLGYYSRCKNLIASAKFIDQVLEGKFPDNYNEILKLKGVGPYTAAAIASFAFDEPVPVLDGNVYRVLARYFAEPEPIDTTVGKEVFINLLQQVFDKRHPAQFNQAIMDFGATVCTPKSPNCEHCCLKERCKAFNQNVIAQFPIKSKKLKIETRIFNYFLLVYNNEIYIQQRQAKDIWHNLYEFYLQEGIETNIDFLEKDSLIHIEHCEYTGKQRLTHRVIESKFNIVSLKFKPKKLPKNGLWVPKEKLNTFPFPKTILSFLEEMPYF